jgi:hypothetical protein
MSPQQESLLLLQVIISLAVLTYIGTLLLKARKEKLKFRFFAVRDQFLYQAATGALGQDTQVFKVFYHAMNIYVSQMEQVTLMSFIRASMAVKTELAKENQQRLIDSLNRAEPEVQKTVNDFIRIVIEAMKFNTPVLTLLITFAVHCSKLWGWVSKLRSRIRFSSAMEFYAVYDTYRFYDNLQGRLSVSDKHLAAV